MLQRTFEYDSDGEYASPGRSIDTITRGEGGGRNSSAHWKCDDLQAKCHRLALWRFAFERTVQEMSPWTGSSARYARTHGGCRI